MGIQFIRFRCLPSSFLCFPFSICMQACCSPSCKATTYLPVMTSKYMFSCVILLVFLCFFLMKEPPDCCSTSANTACLKEIENRKLLSLKDKKTNVKGILHGSSSSQNGEKSLSWELRKVPSGPDPLHHNGGNPKKPRTP